MSENLSIENQVIVALRRISRAIDLHSRALVQQHGLTAPQLAALQAVGELQPASLSAVARSIHLSMATVTGIVGRLEKRGVVKRSRNGHDRRTVSLELTPCGTEVLRSAPSLLQDSFRSELAKLEQWEQTQLLASLQHIATMMDAEGIEAAPVLGAGVVTALPEDVSRYLEVAVKLAEETPEGVPELSFGKASGFQPQLDTKTAQ